MYFGRLLAAFVGVIIFIVILVLLFGHGGKKPVVPGETLKPLPEYAATDATVVWTTDGIVNGDEMHRSIRITVSANQRQLDVLQGYNPRVISSKTFVNNQEAYTVFLTAIGNAGFLVKDKKSKVPASPAGQCPLGFRTSYILQQNGDNLSNLWSSTCGAKFGTLAGASSTINLLFQYQIPNYNGLVSNVNLSATQ